MRSDVGDQLRAARERAGHEIAEVAAALRIRQVYLHALEDGRFSDLPAPVYVIGFIRSYGEFVGLDGEAVVRLFKDEAEGFEASGKFEFPVPAEEGRWPTATLVIVSLLIAAAIFGAWRYTAVEGRTVLEVVSQLPGRFLPLLKESEPDADGNGESAEVSRGQGTGGSAGKREAALPAVPLARLSSAPATESAANTPRVKGAEPDEVQTSWTSAATDVPASESVAATEVASVEPAVEIVGAAQVQITPSSSEPAATVAPASSPPPAPPYVDAETRVSPSSAVSGADGALAALTPPEPSPEVSRPPPNVVTEDVITVAPLPAPPATRAQSTPDREPGGYVPQVYGAGNREVRVVIRARSDSWVQVQGANNELVLTRMLRAGDSYLVPNRDDLMMVTGNAGAIEITVDGTRLPPIGPLGAVRRNISLDADRLLASVAARE